ncbi:dihydrodipicolinate synthase family protein [Natronosalvus halobius]|uniref:dihydrodipicolinate synthase family protein n=1 Tax=Natronosalvus halobius TaxID=2953746 RepID=UPI00209EA2DE|nr:dihydrodipicolinate synthase family protein [Natronosalvus halobius]USZ72413.1 dihydrodipicolinate synthase family protein [Natronosalvus halobius]
MATAYGDLRESLQSVAFTTPTPFSADRDRVLHEEIEQNARTLYDAGARTFIPCGNTGEYYSLSQDERIDVIQSTVDALPDDATVVGGVGGSAKNAVELIEAYDTAGVDAVMVMYPRHTYIHEQGLIEYYRTLAAATDLGIVLYKRGDLLSETVLDDLSTIDNVVAVKYAVNDVKLFSRLVQTVSGDVEWLNGVAERYALAYAIEGADGFTTGIGNFVPKPVLALDEALSAGDWDRARRIKHALRPFEEFREEHGGGSAFSSAKNVPVVKYGQELQGMAGGPVREPLVELSSDDRDRVERYLERLESQNESTSLEA